MQILQAIKAKWKEKRVRIVSYAILCGVIGGFSGLLIPAEDVLIGARMAMKRHAAPQDIVVVAIDDKTLQRIDADDVNRSMDADVIRNLVDAGANRIIFDRIYPSAGNQEDDSKLIGALASQSGQVFFGAGPSDKDEFMDPLSVLPAKKFRDHVGVVGLALIHHPFGLTVSYPFESETVEGPVPSLSGELGARREPPRALPVLRYFTNLPQGFFRPDYSMDVHSIPTLSYIDILNGDFDRAGIAGRDIVIAPVAATYRDNFVIQFIGETKGAYLHVIAAQTLRHGTPFSLGWLPALALVSVVIISGIGRGRAFDIYRVAGLMTFLVLGPLLLDEYLIDVEVMPAALAAGVAIFRARTLDRVEKAEETNVASGLMTIQSLRSAAVQSEGSLVALKLRNYGAITGSFAEPVEAQIAEELVRRIRIGDPDAVVYHEGDKFLWVSSLTNPTDIVEHLEGLHRIVQNGLVILDREIDVSFNCGVETDSDKPVSTRVANALQLAEQAVKDDEIVCLSNLAGKDLHWEISLLSSLDRAIDNGEVWVAYQPKFDLRAGRIVSAEALVRWTHPERGPISPEQFVGIAEDYHRIDRITRFVLQQAAQSAAEINRLGIDYSVSVNVSAQLLRNPKLPEWIEEVLSETKLQPEKLILEITETDRLERSSKTFEMLQSLVESGVQLSIDDFGTGNATIDYLRYLPAKEVKIDKVFVSNMETNREDMLLVQSIIEMAHSLDRRVVAEGVENKEVCRLLEGLGCDQVQGYQISRPVHLEVLLEMLDPAMVKKYS